MAFHLASSPGPCLRAHSRPAARQSVVCLASSNPGAKVERWLKTPFDVLSFGPRAAVGALVSLPERLQMLQADVEKVTELIQDPRPIEEKQQVVLQEVEDTLVEFLERGATVETDVLNNLKQALPGDVVKQLDELIPPPPNQQPAVIEVIPEDPPVVYTADAVLENQIASEMSEIRTAVAAVKSALEELRSNTDPSRNSMLRLNLREARDMLSRRLAEAAPGVAPAGGGSDMSGSLAAATREASMLLDEVDGQFGFRY